MPRSRKRRRTPGKRPLPPTRDAILERQREAFRARFGREPTLDDPMFFDPSNDVPTPLDPKAEILAAMDAAGTPPQIRFAYERTGLLISQENLDEAPPENVQAWEDAVDLYFALEELSARDDAPAPAVWSTEVADLLATFTNDDLAVVQRYIASMAEFERATPMTTAARVEVAAAYVANALESAYEAAEAAVERGMGPSAFARAERTIMRRALEIYAQRGGS